MKGEISMLILIGLISPHASKLIFAFEMFRHGARAPTMLDTDNIDLFGQKWEKKMELTPTGLRQHYIVGVRNRERFIEQNKLLSETFDPKELYVVSTDTSRTLNSAFAQLQGLYPTGTGGKLINENQIKRAVPPNDISAYKKEMDQLRDLALPNQIEIIPIHTIYPQDNDFFLYSPTYCPNLKESFDLNNKRPELLNLLDKFNTKYEKNICSLLKSKNETCINHNVTYALNILETIHAEYVDNRDMKNFSDKGINVEGLVKDCIDFAALHLIGRGIDNDKKIGQVGMSDTFRKIFNWMNKTIENKSPGKYSQPKLVMISAHDASIGAFEALMKAAFDFPVIFSSFASNLFVELYVSDAAKPTEKDYTVKYIFDDKEIGSMPYTVFVSKISSFLMTQEEIADFCDLSKDNTLTIVWIALISIFALINVIIIGFIIHICFNKPTNQSYTGIKESDKTY